MSMPRVYIDRPLAPDTSVDLNERQTRYLARALRLRVGDGVVLFDGSGTEYPATLTSIRRNDSVVRTGQGRRRSVESLLDIRLLQAVCKGEKMDMVVQKATELGVSRISPVLTHYGVVKFTADRAASRHVHWQRIAQSACEQCGRNVVPAVDPPVPLEGLFGDISTEDSCKLILLPDAATTAASLDQPGRRFRGCRSGQWR